MNFSQKLKELRTEKGISKVTMAKKLDIPYTTYNNYENGREPKYETLRKIARILNVTLNELLGDNGFNKYMDDIKNEWAHPEMHNYMRFINNLQAINYTLNGDESEGYMRLANAKHTIEVTEDEISELISEVDSYLLFRIEQLKKKKEDKKEYYK